MNNFIVVEVNGKTVKIPSADIAKYQEKYEMSQEEAIQMWIEDEGYEDNAEVVELEAKGKAMMRTVHDARKNTVKRERKPKEDPEKEFIVAEFAKFLSSFGYEGAQVENVQITNKTKVVEFDLGGNHYKLDLIRQRPAK